MGYIAELNTSMHYPIQLTDTGYGLSLLLPVPGQVRSVYETLYADDPSTPFPFWAKIWSASYALSDFLKSEPELVQGKQLLEIGAGIGLPSFIIANTARKVIISDHAPEAVKLMEENIRLLGVGNATAFLLDWNHIPENISADIILLSDVNYAPDQFDPLLKMIHYFLQQDSLVILATPQRITASPFALALQPFIRRTLIQPIMDSGTETDIAILLLQQE